MAKSWRVTEEEGTSDFLFVLEVILCVIILPIGIIVGIVKLISAIAAKKEQKKLQDVETARETDEYNSERLVELTDLRKRGVISEEEFQRLRSEVMRKMMREIDLREQRERRSKLAKKVILIVFSSLVAIFGIGTLLFYAIMGEWWWFYSF